MSFLCFEKLGWFKFLMMFHGHNLQVTRYFSLNFDGRSSRIGDIILQLDEAIISKATKLPAEGERWSKTKRIKDIRWSMFLTSSKTKYNHKGIHASMIKKEWKYILWIIKCYITCEGRYNLFFLYHFHFLMVFVGFKLNMPFFLLKSLTKMEKFYQRDHLRSERNLFHHGLIRILIENHLSHINDSWDEFIKRNDFLETPELNPQTQGFKFGFESTDSKVDDDNNLPQVSVSNQIPTRVTHNQTLNLNSKLKTMAFDTDKQVSFESSDQDVFSSLTSECSKDANSPVLKPSEDSRSQSTSGINDSGEGCQGISGINLKRFLMLILLFA
jgi:hypothetical protein